VITFSSATSIEPGRLVAAIQASRGRLRMRREYTLEAAIATGRWPAVRDSLLGVLAGLAQP
jgi:hypothetical protein